MLTSPSDPTTNIDTQFLATLAAAAFIITASLVSILNRDSFAKTALLSTALALNFTINSLFPQDYFATLASHSLMAYILLIILVLRFSRLFTSSSSSSSSSSSLISPSARLQIAILNSKIVIYGSMAFLISLGTYCLSLPQFWARLFSVFFSASVGIVVVSLILVYLVDGLMVAWLSS